MQTVDSVQKAVDAVAAGAVAVFEDTSPGFFFGDPSVYRLIFSEKEAAEFNRLSRQVEKAGGVQGTAARRELSDLVGIDCYPWLYEILYADGEWQKDPEELLAREREEQRIMEDLEEYCRLESMGSEEW